MKCINDIFAVHLNDIRGTKDRNNTISFSSNNTVHTEATRQACNTTKDGFKCFAHMMRDIIFKYYTKETLF